MVCSCVIPSQFVFAANNILLMRNSNQALVVVALVRRELITLAYYDNCKLHITKYLMKLIPYVLHTAYITKCKPLIKSITSALPNQTYATERTLNTCYVLHTTYKTKCKPLIKSIKSALPNQT